MVTWESIIDLVIASLLVVVTYLLARYTKLLYSATSEQGHHIEKQTKIMQDQLIAIKMQNDNYKTQTELVSDQLETIKAQTENFERQTKIMNLQSGYAEQQTKIMGKQVSYLEEQKSVMENEAKIMMEDRVYRKLVEKYRRLRDEMDNLVAPLYFASLTSGYKEEHLGYFINLDPRWRTEKQNREYLILFWDGIRKNMHLSQSGKLIDLLQKHFEYNDYYYNNILSHNGDPKESKKMSDSSLNSFILNKSELIIEIQDNSYPTLKRELEEIEIKLGIRQSK